MDLQEKLNRGFARFFNRNEILKTLALGGIIKPIILWKINNY